MAGHGFARILEVVPDLEGPPRQSQRCRDPCSHLSPCARRHNQCPARHRAHRGFHVGQGMRKALPRRGLRSPSTEPCPDSFLPYGRWPVCRQPQRDAREKGSALRFNAPTSGREPQLLPQPLFTPPALQQSLCREHLGLLTALTHCPQPILLTPTPPRA